MKFYAAVLSPYELRAPLTCPPYCVLGSYWYFKSDAGTKALADQVAKGYDVFVDSGAFSAENSGKHIDIDVYCEFVRKVGSGLYAGLDVIGDAKKTMENQRYMESKYGLKPIPTFHLGSDLSDLYKLFEYPYIALGGLVFGGGLTRYCDEVWGIILREKPDLKVHGFGMTNLELMERYPWYSVDSSSYKSCRRYGRQLILWNGFEFKMFTEDEYKAHLTTIGYKLEGMENADRWFLYDFHSVQSYKIFAEHLREVNKLKDFSYLTAQQKMF